MQSPLKIGIIGGGFSGVMMANHLARFHSAPIEIFLYEKTGEFGVGDAYRTPYDYHLLNARSKSMSAFEHDALHFTNWLKKKNYTWDPVVPITDQFVPRCTYREYLQDLLREIKQFTHVRLHLISAEVTKIELLANQQYRLYAQDQQTQVMDKVVLAIGHQPAAHWFNSTTKINVIANPWDYAGIAHIPRDAAVLIVGSGLSMVDAILTLDYRKHQGIIYCVSRRGLLPLAHTQHAHDLTIAEETIPSDLRMLTRYIRKLTQQHMLAAADWREVISALRPSLANVWRKLSSKDKQRFLRHAAAYWNIHRHRINPLHAKLLADLIAAKKLIMFKGTLLDLAESQAHLRLRDGTIKKLSIDTLINCTGPGLYVTFNTSPPLLQSLLSQDLAVLDELNLGIMTSPEGALYTSRGLSKSLYAIGPVRKGVDWEVTAVPELRLQVAKITQAICQT